MPHRTKIKDKDPFFEIDAITRQIRAKSNSKTTVIQYDHNSERFTFSLPRIIEGHDMMESTKAEVHYVTAKDETPGLYVMEDLHIDPEDENKVICTWLLSQNVTIEPGAIKFSLRFSCVGEDGEILYAWNTAPFVGISVTPGIYNADAIVEQYADVLEQWHKEIMDAIDEIKISGGGGVVPTKISDLVDDTGEVNGKPIANAVYSAQATKADRADACDEALRSYKDINGNIIHTTYATKAELDSKADIYEVAGEEVYERLYIVEGEKDIIQRVKGYASASSGMVGGTNTSYDSFYFTATKNFECYFEEAEKVNGGYLSIGLYDNGFNIEGATKPSVFLRLSNGDVMPNVEYKLSVKKGQTVVITFMQYGQNESVKFYQNMILTEEPQTVKMLSEDVHIGATHSEDLKPFFNLFTPLVKKEGEILKVYLPLKRRNGYYAYFSFRKFVSESANMNQWKLDEFCITDTKLVNLWTPEVNIEWEGVFKEYGYSDDFIGGYHGDETNEMLSIFIDGLDCDMSGEDFELKNFSEVKIVAKSILNRCNTPDIPIATRYKELIFTENGLEIKNRWIFNDNCQKLYPFYTSMMAIYNTSYNENGVSYCRNNDNYVVQPVGDAIEGSPLSPSTKANIAEMWNDKFLARMTVKEHNLGEYVTDRIPTRLFIQNYPAQNRWKAYFDSNEAYINVSNGSEINSYTLYEFI